jgi:hypothetical protein
MALLAADANSPVSMQRRRLIGELWLGTLSQYLAQYSRLEVTSYNRLLLSLAPVLLKFILLEPSDWLYLNQTQLTTALETLGSNMRLARLPCFCRLQVTFGQPI